MKEKVIIGCFLAFLILPNLTYPLVRRFIDSENYENRAYAPFPDISLGNLEHMPGQFEAYYTDRVPYKNQLKRVKSYEEKVLESPKPFLENVLSLEGAVVGKEDWLFYFKRTEEESSAEDYFGTNLYTENELKGIAETYQWLNGYFQGRGQEFLLFLAPNKEQVYGEYLPADVQAAGQGNRTSQAVAYLKGHTDVPVIWMLDTLLEWKEEYPLYYKYDTHWNKLGAFLGVQEINRRLQGRGESLKNYKVTYKEGRTGDLAKMLGMAKDYKDERDYKVKGYRREVQVETVDRTEKGDYIRMVSNARDQRKALIISDSFAHNMFPYLSKDYGEVIWVTNHAIAKEILSKERPDIVVLEAVERAKNRFEIGLSDLLPEEKEGEP